MARLIIFLAGLLYGWAFEWLIDQIKSRRNAVDDGGLGQNDQISELKAENARLKRELKKYRISKNTSVKKQPEVKISVEKDDLTKINGVGPVFSRALNEVGILTFAQLAALTPDQLKDMLGDKVRNLANEEKIINGAKELI
ncbi:MAG: hypothetical protein JEZ06_18715 [Anaerolineaceae bacterium]|nr:hypothetical protein [Anaerolineaceae bacterium]